MTDKLLQPPLLEKIRNYLGKRRKTKEIFLFVPYIKTKTLSKLVDGLDNITIVTTWHTNDLLSGSSELDLYPFCKEHNYTLYVNNDIHLKVYSVGLDSAIVASGNISHGGLEGGNEECGTFVNELSIQDRLFLEKIKANATFIDEEEYQRHLKLIEEKKKIMPEIEKHPDLIITAKEEHFFKSSLPMTRSVDDLIKAYAKLSMGFEASDDKETKDCIIHDLGIYTLEELGLPQDEFVAKLKIQFFSHPFIKKIEELIDSEAYFGEMKEWIQKNCTDDPTPRRWELTENTQTLYDWLENLGDGKYIVDVPGSHSQRIRRVDDTLQKINNDSTLEYENAVLEFLETDGHTINEIREIYKNLKRSWHVNDEPSISSEKQNASKSFWHYKRELDEAIPKILSLSEEEIGKRTSKGRLSRKLVEIIHRLHEKKLIIKWYQEEEPGTQGNSGGTWSDGIWRLTEEGKREIQRRGLTKTKSNENSILQFKVGQFYHHEKIYQTISGIGAGGGIRPSKDFPIIVVFRRMQNEDEENVYDDNYDEKTGIFHYNARGSGGAEQLEISQNQEIVNAKENGKTIIFFNQHENKGEYEYLGEVELVGTTTEKQLDNGKYTEKLVFLLKPLD